LHNGTVKKFSTGPRHYCYATEDKVSLEHNTKMKQQIIYKVTMTSFAITLCDKCW